jgi:hypothetical protein
MKQSYIAFISKEYPFLARLLADCDFKAEIQRTGWAMSVEIRTADPYRLNLLQSASTAILIVKSLQQHLGCDIDLKISLREDGPGLIA